MASEALSGYLRRSKESSQVESLDIVIPEKHMMGKNAILIMVSTCCGRCLHGRLLRFQPYLRTSLHNVCALQADGDWAVGMGVVGDHGRDSNHISWVFIRVFCVMLKILSAIWHIQCLGGACVHRLEVYSQQVVCIRSNKDESRLRAWFFCACTVICRIYLDRVNLACG